jgi:hypothetical protein
VQLPPRAAGATAPPPLPPRRASVTAPPLGAPGAAVAASAPGPVIAPGDDRGRGSLLDALSPGPAAQRREAPPPAPRAPGEPAPAPLPPPSEAGPARGKPPSIPPRADAAGGGAPARAGLGHAAPGPTAPSGTALGLTPATPAAPAAGLGHAAPAAVAAPGAPGTPPPPRPAGLRLAPPPAPPPLGHAPPPADFDDDPHTVRSAPAFVADPIAAAIASVRARGSGEEPPPTHIHRPESHVDRPFTPPRLQPVPEVPEAGLVHAARYAVRFGRARWQRRGAIKALGAEIKQDTGALDQVLGALGRAARGARITSRVLAGENAAIDTCEARIEELAAEQRDVEARRAEELAKFVDVEAERNTKLGEAERMVDEAQRELAQLEGQRRSLRDSRKELERRQRAHLKGAEDSERAAAAAQLPEQRQEQRRAAEQFRKEAAALDPDRQEAERRLAALERPISEATARLDAGKAELDAAKRSLADAREGHTHRLAELDAEQKRKAREVALSEGEIARRLVTLGTLVNLNRVEDPQFAELYLRIDRLRGAITARTTEIEKLTAEREAFDRGTLVRGIAAIGGAFVAVIALIVILRAVI